MAYLTKLQVIQRGGQNRQYYLICPAPMAAALEMEKGEELNIFIREKTRSNGLIFFNIEMN